jgi:hypothetical protein
VDAGRRDVDAWGDPTLPLATASTPELGADWTTQLPASGVPLVESGLPLAAFAVASARGSPLSRATSADGDASPLAVS